MAKPTVEEFKNFVEAQDDLNIEWFGAYNGRFYHQGIAVSGSLADGGRLVERMQNLGPWTHQDNLAFDHIMSWDVSCFRSDVKDEQTKSEKQLWMDAIKGVKV